MFYNFENTCIIFIIIEKSYIGFGTAFKYKVRSFVFLKMKQSIFESGTVNARDIYFSNKIEIIDNTQNTGQNLKYSTELFYPIMATSKISRRRLFRNFIEKLEASLDSICGILENTINVSHLMFH